MKQWRLALYNLVFVFAWAAAPLCALQISEEPYASGRILQAKYQPLINYLQQQGLSAAYLRTESYGQYVSQAQRASQAGQPGIDVAFASSGLASLLVNRFGYVPVLVSDNTLNAVVFVPANSKIQTLAELATARILVPEPYDIVSEMARRLFKVRQLEHVLLPRLTQTTKVDRIILSVMNGEYDAGVVAGFDVALVAPELRGKMRTIDQSESVTAHYILLRGSMPAEQQAQLKELLGRFHTSAEGDVYANDFGSSRFVPLMAAHQQELQDFREFGEFISRAR